MKNKIDYEILNKRVEYLIEKLDSLEDFVNFDPADFLKRLTKVEAMLFTSKEMLTSEEACYYLGISMSQLYKMTSAHTIPHYKPRGKQVYFCKKELDEWMKNDPVVTTRKSSVSGYMLTDAQLTELIEKSTVKATEKPGQSKNSSNGNGKRQ